MPALPSGLSVSRCLKHQLWALCIAFLNWGQSFQNLSFNSTQSSCGVFLKAASVSPQSSFSRGQKSDTWWPQAYVFNIGKGMPPGLRLRKQAPLRGKEWLNTKLFFHTFPGIMQGCVSLDYWHSVLDDSLLWEAVLPLPRMFSILGLHTLYVSSIPSAPSSDNKKCPQTLLNVHWVEAK